MKMEEENHLYREKAFVDKEEIPFCFLLHEEASSFDRNPIRRIRLSPCIADKCEGCDVYKRKAERRDE